MISNISYELRSPLNTIMGFSEILHNKYFGDLNDKQLEYCKGIFNSVGRLTEVVEAIINLASIEAGQMKLKYSEVNLFKFINDSISLFSSRTALQNITLKTNFSIADIKVLFDEPSMEQVMFQLISKAIKMTPNGGRIDVFVEFPETNPDYFEIIISDTGIGMSEEELDKNRKMLETELESGTADKSIEFGFMLANNIIRLHNGKISIDSKIDKGTKVTCLIPKRQFLQ